MTNRIVRALYGAKEVAYLPLVVTLVEEDRDGIGIAGPNWRFRINTTWRLVGAQDPSNVRLTSEDPGSVGTLREIVTGDEVVALELCRHEEFGDLKTVLRGGSAVEVVSDFPYGEWIFSIWRADDPGRMPVFDLSGPLG